MFCKMAHFQRGSSGCSQAQPLDTASVGSLPWAAGHLSATCSALSLGSNVPGQLCTCSEGHTWLLLHRSVPNHTWPGWAGPPGSGYDLLGSPSTMGAVLAVPHTGSVQAAVISPEFCYNKRCIFMVSYNKLRCQTPLEPPCQRGAMGLGCPWGWAVLGAGLSLGLACPWGAKGGLGLAWLWGRRAVGSQGCGAGQAMRPGCPVACPEACTGPGAVGPGCPLGHGQQVPTLPSPSSADVSGPTCALPGHVLAATLCQGAPGSDISPLA